MSATAGATPPEPTTPPAPAPEPELAGRMPRLLDAMASIGGDIELHTLLDRIVRTAAELTDARYAALAVLNDAGDAVSQFVTHGLDPSVHERVGHLPGSRGLIRTLLEQPGPLRAPDVAGAPRAAGFPPGHPAMRSLIGVPIRVHGAAFGALYLADKTTGQFTAETSTTEAFTAEDMQTLRMLATEAGVAIGNARLYEAVRQQARWMDGSVELSASLLSEDTDNALAVVAEQARRLADASAALVLVPADDRGLEVVATCALPDLLGTVLRPDGELAEQLLTGEPTFIDDARTDTRVTPGLSRHCGPLMLLPLTRDGRTLGILALPRAPESAPYSVPERVMATEFAQQAALALVLAEAQRDREQLAVYEDRDRIARDLHDLVIQRLFAVGMILTGAQRATSPDAQERAAAAIDTATRELDATIQEIRTAIFALQQPPDEAPTGLRTRVLRETGTTARVLGFQPSVTFTGPVDARVVDDTAGNLVAALREALSNATRHARATRVDVVIDATAHLADGSDAVRLTVADNGIGLPAEDRRRSGLRNLMRRATALGGAADLGPGPDGAGTTLTWQAPL